MCKSLGMFTELLFIGFVITKLLAASIAVEPLRRFDTGEMKLVRFDLWRSIVFGESEVLFKFKFDFGVKSLICKYLIFLLPTFFNSAEAANSYLFLTN